MIHKFMQNWSCTPPCGHSSIKFGGHVKLRLRIHFSYLTQPSVSKRYSFINLCAHPSPFQAFEKTFIAFTLVVYTHIFFSKNHLCFDRWIFFQRKTDSYFFSKRAGFLVKKIFFSFLFVVVCYFFWPFFQSIFLNKRLKTACNPGTVDIWDLQLIKKACEWKTQI